MRNLVDKFRMQYSPMKALFLGVSVAIFVMVLVFIYSQVSKMGSEPTTATSSVGVTVDQQNE